MVFAAIGRASHAESLDVPGVLTTAWPFVVGAVIGQAVTMAWRRPSALWPTGVIVWAAAVGGGMLLRVVTGSGTATAFVIVATITLAVFLLGWRLIARIAVRRR